MTCGFLLPERHYSLQVLLGGEGLVDLVVIHLSLIDISDISAAIPEMARVLEPG